MSRTLVITNDFPPRPGGIQAYLHALLTRQPAGSVVVYASRFRGWEKFDAEQLFRVVRHPRGLLLPTPYALCGGRVEIARPRAATRCCTARWHRSACLRPGCALPESTGSSG